MNESVKKLNISFVIYARESSDDTAKAPPIERQIEIGKNQLAGLECAVVKVYQDNGFSGGDWNRPDWNALVTAAKNRARDFEGIWVFAQDRLARDTEQFLWFYRNLKEAGIKVLLSGTEGEIDMETAGGRLMHSTLANADEFMRLSTSDKVKKAYANKVIETEKTHTPLEWGRKALKIDMEAVKKLRDEGKGWRSIARELGGVSHVTIKNRYEMLRNTPPKLTDEKKVESECVKE